MVPLGTYAREPSTARKCTGAAAGLSGRDVRLYGEGAMGGGAVVSRSSYIAPPRSEPITAFKALRFAPAPSGRLVFRLRGLQALKRFATCS